MIKLTKEQKKELRLQISAEILSRSYYDFLVESVKILEPSTNWLTDNWSIRYICDVAQGVIEGVGRGEEKDRDLLINLCPRSMKSIIWSVTLNAWAWIKFPHLKFMTISYSDTLSSSFAYKTRNLISSEWYQKRWGHVFSINSDDNRKTSYSNSMGGSRMSFSFAGAITGEGADIIIIDDPAKASDISDVKLNNVIETFRDVIFNRINNPRVGIRIVIGQRTDESDLFGHLLSTQPDQYTHICIPMELNDQVTPEGLKENYINGLLWPERFNEKSIIEYKSNLGTRTYDTQYLQSPKSNTGTLIHRDWFDIIDYYNLPYDKQKEIDNIKWEMFIDSSYTSDQKNDATAILIGGKWGNNVLVKKVYTFYLEFPDLVKKIIEISGQLTPSSRIFIEPKASGKSIVQQIKFSTNLNVIELESPKDSKVVRVTSITSKLESKRCSLMKDGSNGLFLQQVTAFPFSKADDIVDVLYYMVNKYISGGGNFSYSM